MINSSKFHDKMTTRIKTFYEGESILPESRLFFMGSCFSQNISRRLSGIFMNAEDAPFGTIYNPLSLAKSTEMLLSPSLFKRESIFKHNDLYSHFAFHTEISSSVKEKFITDTESALKEKHQQLINADFLIITLGTAFYFLENKSEIIVNNCHKLPSEEFTRRVASPQVVERTLLDIFKSVNSINPGIQMILTLSPVRHMRDTPTENSYSKAILRYAIEQVTENENCYYFPSYEILLDELRDYRWYGPDRMHPSEEAADYIAARFIETMGNEQTESFVTEARQLAASLAHRPRHPSTEAHKQFQENLKKDLKKMQKRYPQLERLEEVKL